MASGSCTHTPLPGLISQTNMNGVYVIHEILPGVYKTCVIGPNNLPVAYSAEFTVVEGAITDSVNIILDVDPPIDQFGSVSGTVIGAQMEPGMMLNVGLVHLDDLDTVIPGLFGHAGHMGYYCIQNVPVGTYKACVIGQDMTPVAYSETFDVTAGQLTQNVDIIIGDFVGYSVSGTIYDAQSQPVQQGIDL